MSPQAPPRDFVAPMALALSWGLAFATLVTLLTIPAAFVAATRVKEGLLQLIKRDDKE